MTYSIWMLLPNNVGWSRVAAGLSQEDADRLVVTKLFPARAMPDEEKSDG